MKIIRDSLLLFAALVMAVGASAQQRQITREEMSKHERARYDQMNSQGVWSIGVGITPVTPLSHASSILHGGQKISDRGLFGMSIEGGYFVVDNMRVSAEFSHVSNSSSALLMWNGVDSFRKISNTSVILGAQWHIGRFNIGGGLLIGGSKLKYYAPDVENGEVGIEGEPTIDFTERNSIRGLSYEANYMLSPFMKIGLFYRPTLTRARGKGYLTSTAGFRAVIYLPFIDAVVCR